MSCFQYFTENAIFGFIDDIQGHQITNWPVQVLLLFRRLKIIDEIFNKYIYNYEIIYKASKMAS